MHPGDGRVVSNFIMQALNGAPITIYGDGRQTRSFCYVDDMIDALLLLMDSSPSFVGPVNLGNPQECTIADLAALVVELTGSASTIVHGPRPQDDPMRRMPDIALAGRALGWSPQIALDEGLARDDRLFQRLAGTNSEPVRPRLVTAFAGRPRPFRRVPWPGESASSCRFEMPDPISKTACAASSARPSRISTLSSATTVRSTARPRLCAGGPGATRESGCSWASGHSARPEARTG
jgi:hypothetical protein